MNEFKIKINGNDYNIVVGRVEDNQIDMEVNGQLFPVEMEQAAKPVRITKPATKAVETTVSSPKVQISKPVAAAPSAGKGSVKSPLPGVILEIAVNVGDTVSTGQKLFVLEAMKMENSINSDKDGKVAEIKVQKGDSVLEGADLIVIT
ncbi:MAG: biotin/lipoyl-binding protein [Prevotellaceae bacterium]|jgi:biotin carboxyl carrier protein|nr:biotin/lipoyl-binding protein [Prevotellaceae bacterium]